MTLIRFCMFALAAGALALGVRASAHEAKEAPEVLEISVRAQAVATAERAPAKISVRVQDSKENIDGECQAASVHGNLLAMGINKGDLVRANTALLENGRVKLVRIAGGNGGVIVKKDEPGAAVGLALARLDALSAPAHELASRAK